MSPMLAEQRSRDATADGLHANSTGGRTLVIAWLCGILWVAGAAAHPAQAQSPSGDEPLREMRPEASASGSEDGEAKASEDEPPLEALELFNLARAHYQAGRYEQALTHLSRALEKDPGSLDLLYNIARVHELLGNLDEAIDYYERYLDRLPQSAEQEREHTRETLERLRGAREHMVAREEPARTVVQPSAPGRADWLFWTTATGSVLLAGGGVFAAIVASNKDDAVQQYVLGPDGGPARRDAIASNARAWALTADILFLSAGVAAATTALLYFLRDAEPQSRETAGTPRLGLAVAAQGRGAVLTWSGSL